MGIQGLLPLLKTIQRPTNLRSFAGLTLGVDAYGWLHRGTFACSAELAQNLPTRRHIDFALARVRMLLDFGITPFIVFDGDNLPAKARTDSERKARREASRQLGLELLAMGRGVQAGMELQKAVDVTPAMARQLIEELKGLGVRFVVAPYEADAQLAYLEKKGTIDGVVSEDSDLLVFGVARLITKLDGYGDCVEIRKEDFTACTDVSLAGWSDKDFRAMAILSGCDYLPGIERMGLKTAHRLLRKHKTVERLVRAVMFDGKTRIPQGYLEDYTRAEQTFLYQWVYCLETKALVNLNPLDAGMQAEDLPHIGHSFMAETATGVANGDLDPNTKEPLEFKLLRREQSSSRKTVTQTPDDKQGKPITDFFKSKRTPLAELDPNSFTLSPTQQRLLENQQSLSWSASHAPIAHAQASRSTVTVQAPSSAPQLNRPNVSQPARGSIDAAKRQRLCSDSVIATAMGGRALEPTTSRFFAKQSFQDSPSLRKTTTRLQRRKDDFELWSDDSVAEAVAEMTATAEQAALEKQPPASAPALTSSTTPSPRKRKNLSVYVDPEKRGDGWPKEPGPSASPNASCQTTTDLPPHPRNKNGTATTSVNSATSPASPEARRTVFSKGLATDFAAFKAKYSCQALSSRSNQSASAQSKSFERDQRKRVNDQSCRMTQPAKQTEGVESECVSEAAVEVPLSSPLNPPAPSSGCEGDSSFNESSDSRHNSRQYQRQRSQPKSFPCHGSEDLLVPNSPQDESNGSLNDDDDDDDDRGNSIPRFNLDLGRFAFSV